MRYIKQTNIGERNGSFCAGSGDIRCAEHRENETSLNCANDGANYRPFEAAGVEFIDENGGGPGVRLRKPGPEKPRK